MRSFTPLIVAVTAIASVLAQYNDGYETVNLPTDPVQIRLAYQGPNGMMGKQTISVAKPMLTTYPYSFLEYLPAAYKSYRLLRH